MLVKAFIADDNNIHSRPFGPLEIEENDRQYQSFRRGIRSDIGRTGSFGPVPRAISQVIDRNLLRLLGLGIVTGILAVAIAERYPSTEVSIEYGTS
ncbi:hypothetical protein MMC31_008142 [Peltigera leucophlebia]|nr:hypothetical protein [Peltigera leucophlebia]